MRCLCIVGLDDEIVVVVVLIVVAVRIVVVSRCGTAPPQGFVAEAGLGAARDQSTNW